MIYKQSFVDYLNENLGEARFVSNNIVVPCPWCDTNPNRTKDHLYISTEAPVFNCFRADCPVGKGSLPKLVRKLEGYDVSNNFIDNHEFSKIKKSKSLEKKKSSEYKKFNLPELRIGQFPNKELCIKRRLRFSINVDEVKGLIFDVDNFVNNNNISTDGSFGNIKPFLHSNFIGFTSEHHGYVSFRNIHLDSPFRFYKLHLQKTPFMDYFKLDVNKNSSMVILAEGIFDIYSEYLFDYLGLKKDCRLYASIQSDSFNTLVKSLAFYEQIFRQDVVILADRNVSIEYFKKLKFFNSHLINSIVVYYNMTGKDFNSSVVSPEKFSI